jgi:hypothetical protein
MNEQPLLQRTLRTVGVMVGACVLFLGALSLTAALVLRAPGPTEQAAPKTVASKVHPS